MMVAASHEIGTVCPMLSRTITMRQAVSGIRRLCGETPSVPGRGSSIMCSATGLCPSYSMPSTTVFPPFPARPNSPRSSRSSGISSNPSGGRPSASKERS